MLEWSVPLPPVLCCYKDFLVYSDIEFWIFTLSLWFFIFMGSVHLNWSLKRLLGLTGYYLHGHKISQVNSHKDFCALVGPSLRFHNHIKSVINKASGLSANLFRCNFCLSQDLML